MNLIMWIPGIWLLFFGILTQFMEQPLVSQTTLYCVAVMMLVALAVQWYLKRRAEKSEAWRYGVPVSERPDEKLTDVSTAIFLWQPGGISCTLRMLDSLEKALGTAGYGLTRSKVEYGSAVRSVDDMHPHRRERVIAELLRAREVFWAPAQPEEELRALTTQALKSGFGQKMLEELITNLQKRGWQMHKVKSDYELVTWPVQQMVVKVTGEENAQQEDLIGCLQHLCIRGFHGADDEHHEENGRFPVEDGRRDVKFTVTRRLCDSPPGFFPEKNQTRLPPWFTDGMDEFRTSFRNHIVLIIQYRSHAVEDLPEALMAEAVGRLEQGCTMAVDEKDDTGYAFCCQGRCFD